MEIKLVKNSSWICQLCGNFIFKYEEGCQSGGPMPDGCCFNSSGFKDIFRRHPSDD